MSSSSSDFLFSKDPSILFGDGNYSNFDTDTRTHKGNTLARIVIYVSVVWAVLRQKPAVLLYALVGLALISVVFAEPDTADLPLNTYYKDARSSPTALVHDRATGISREHRIEDFRNGLLNNVRERNFYLGGTTGAQKPSEYMLGGTRPLAPNHDDMLRQNPFFQNVSNNVHFESIVPSRGWF